MMPEPHMPTGASPPMSVNVGSIVSASMVAAQMAPSVARMPQAMSPPSNAGPAEHAHVSMKSAFPNTSSPFVPRSMNSVMRSSVQSMLVSTPAVMSPPT